MRNLWGSMWGAFLGVCIALLSGIVINNVVYKLRVIE